MNPYEKLFKLWSSICKMIVDGARDPEEVAEVLQSIVNKQSTHAEINVVGHVLEFLGPVTISATEHKFVVRNEIASIQKKVKIGYFNDHFCVHFISKVEEPIRGQYLRYAYLNTPASDMQIINEQGGEKKSETTLTGVFALLEKQPNGEDGVLLTDGNPNIFYILDCACVLCTFWVHWRKGTWRLSSRCVRDSSVWRNGSWVFSQNSALKF